MGSNTNRALSIPAIAYYIDPEAPNKLVPNDIAQGNTNWNMPLQKQILRVIEQSDDIESISAAGKRYGVSKWNMKDDGNSVFNKGQTIYYDSKGKKGRRGGGLPPAMFPITW